VIDCWAEPREAGEEYGITLLDEPGSDYDAVLLAVPHREYAGMSSAELRGMMKDNGVLFDLKGVLPLGESDLRL
jgi:UDP-N-acetyl-D-galactosamine dehydrogenase